MKAVSQDKNIPASNQHVILLADDHPLNRKVGQVLLQRMGFDVDVVAGGAEAVAASSKREYDVILMDCHMPEVDGFAATQQIREHERLSGKRVPIIAVTALDRADDRERCLAAGMDDYLTKPIDSGLLRTKLIYWTSPSAKEMIASTDKVIQLFDSAFSLDTKPDHPLDVAGFFDAYTDQAPELLRLFLESSSELLGEQDTAIEARDVRRVAYLAHELKGASWAVGANEMARLAIFIEQASIRENWRLVRRTFARLVHEFVDVRKFVEAQLALESRRHS